MKALIMKIVYFVTLTDPEIIKACDDHEKNLVISSLIRQVTSFLFILGVSIYGLEAFLPKSIVFWASLLLSGILFMINQIIISYAWSVKSKFQFSWINQVVNLICVPIKILPIIALSIVLSFFIATSVELRIQKDLESGNSNLIASSDYLQDHIIHKDNNEKNLMTYIKILVFAIQFFPVIVALFFCPYGLYDQQMQQKQNLRRSFLSKVDRDLSC